MLCPSCNCYLKIGAYINGDDAFPVGWTYDNDSIIVIYYYTCPKCGTVYTVFG